jgi:outer membrane receptor protein involved in Fe transport
MGKYSGQYSLYTAAAPSPDQPLPAGTLTYIQGGYVLHDLSLGYGTKFSRGAFLKSIKVRLQINNLFNRDVILMKAAKATAGAVNLQTSTFNPLTPRGLFLTVSTEF